MDKSILVSVVIPVFNEEGNIGPLSAALDASLRSLGSGYEVIFVDDGSTDATRARLVDACNKYPCFTALCLGINSGKTVAYGTGFDRAAGSIIVTMDGDQQDDPAEIPKFIDEIGKGFDCVVGWKHSGKGTASKTMFSHLFNGLVSMVTGTHFHDMNCPFRALTARCAKSLRMHGDMYRFIPFIARARGFRVAEIKVENRPQISGRSKYGAGRFVKGLLDVVMIYFLVRFQEAPLHFFGVLGMACFAGGFSIDLGLVLHGFLVSGVIGHFAMLLFGILLMLLGIQFVSLGLLGELMLSGRKHDERAIAVTTVVGSATSL
jgi:glycosyltransferase involved in cell wall biosynthesis